MDINIHTYRVNKQRGKTKGEGRRHKVHSTSTGFKGGVLDTHIGSDYCDKYEIMCSFRSLILSISSKFHGASDLAKGLFANSVGVHINLFTIKLIICVDFVSYL